MTRKTISTHNKVCLTWRSGGPHYPEEKCVSSVPCCREQSIDFINTLFNYCNIFLGIEAHWLPCKNVGHCFSIRWFRYVYSKHWCCLLLT